MATNNIFFHKVDPKIKKDLSELYNITKTMQESFFKTLYPKEIYAYIEYFLSEDSLKDKIEFDGHTFYLILKGNSTIGFFHYRTFSNILLIADIFLIKKERKKGTSNLVLDFVKQEAKSIDLNRLWAFVYQKNENAKNIFKKWNFKKINTQARYLGSDIFLFESIFEYNLD